MALSGNVLRCHTDADCHLHAHPSAPPAVSNHAHHDAVNDLPSRPRFCILSVARTAARMKKSKMLSSMMHLLCVTLYLHKYMVWFDSKGCAM